MADCLFLRWILEQPVVKLDTVRRCQAANANCVSRGDVSSGLPIRHGVRTNAEYWPEHCRTAEEVANLRYCIQVPHTKNYSHFVSAIKCGLSERTKKVINIMMEVMKATKKDNLPAATPVDSMVPDVDAVFERINLIAEKSEYKSTRAMLIALGVNSPALYNHKRLKSLPTYTLLKPFKRRFGVDFDWLIEGDESGLSMEARKFLFGPTDEKAKKSE